MTVPAPALVVAPGSILQFTPYANRPVALSPDSQYLYVPIAYSGSSEAHIRRLDWPTLANLTTVYTAATSPREANGDNYSIINICCDADGLLYVIFVDPATYWSATFADRRTEYSIRRIDPSDGSSTTLTSRLSRPGIPPDDGSWLDMGFPFAGLGYLTWHPVDGMLYTFQQSRRRIASGEGTLWGPSMNAIKTDLIQVDPGDGTLTVVDTTVTLAGYTGTTLDHTLTTPNVDDLGVSSMAPTLDGGLWVAYRKDPTNHSDAYSSPPYELRRWDVTDLGSGFTTPGPHDIPNGTQLIPAYNESTDVIFTVDSTPDENTQLGPTGSGTTLSWTTPHIWSGFWEPTMQEIVLRDVIDGTGYWHWPVPRRPQGWRVGRL